MNLNGLIILLGTAGVLTASTGTTPIRYTGAPPDGGQTCSACHSGAANSDSRGSVSIAVTDYNPGVVQTIHISVQHPTAIRWGFQLTARVVNDLTAEAGSFAPVDGQVQVRCDDGSQLGTPGPCAGTREFAEHVLAPGTGTAAGFTFDVSWTPPANEVGQVNLYVAAVAGNGDGSSGGDFVYSTVKTVAFTGACTLTKKPTLRTALNGASFQPAFSSNAMMSVFGQDFQVPGRTRLAGAGDIINGQFPKQLGCVAVEMNGQRVPIAYIQQDQINVQAPTFQGAGSVSLVVIANPDRPNELRSDLAMLSSQQLFAPAFFTFSGTSQIAAQFANTSTLVADPAVIPGARQAKPGDILTLYATGLGDTSPSVASGQVASAIARTTSVVTVTIGGVTLPAGEVFYAGLSPNSISGLYQINVRVPGPLADGNVPVVISVGGSQSQAGAFIPVKN